MPEKAATPDGNSVLVWLDGKWFLYPIDGGQPRPISALGTGDSPRGGALTDVSSTSRAAAALFLRSRSSGWMSPPAAASRGRRSSRPIPSASSSRSSCNQPRRARGIANTLAATTNCMSQTG